MRASKNKLTLLFTDDIIAHEVKKSNIKLLRKQNFGCIKYALQIKVYNEFTVFFYTSFVKKKKIW